MELSPEVVNEDHEQDNVAQTETDPLAGVLDVMTETSNYAVTKTTNDAGEVKYSFSILKEGNTLSKAIAEGKVELVQEVAISIPVANTLAGVSTIVSDEDEAVSIWNKGAKQKVLTRITSRFTEVDPVTGELVHADETEYDASDDIAEPLRRRNLTEGQKTKKFLESVSKTALTEALRAMGYIS